MVYLLRPGQPAFPHDLEPDRFGLVALGGVMTPALLVEAYAKGIFPWSGEDPIPWYSPDPRLILLPKHLRLGRTVKKVMRRGTYEVRYDTRFMDVMRACADTERPEQDGTWINGAMWRAYGALHELGIAHSAEAYLDGELVGGLYGLSLGAAFFGESMFAHAPDASKVAFATFCNDLVAAGFDFIDCQQDTPHLRSFGAHLVTRDEYLRRLDATLHKHDPQRQRAWTEGVPGPLEG